MKKLLLCALLMFASVPAFASGRITFQPKYTFGQKGITPMIGLSVYEKVYGPIAANAWAGVGSDTFTDHQQTWYVIKNTFELPMGPLTLGVGGEVGYLDRDALNTGSDKSWRGAVFGKVALKLW